MSKVFVSYRRDDSAGFAGRLTDALERRFGADSVFRDVDDIAAGADFGVVIEQALQQVQAVLVVIGILNYLFLLGKVEPIVDEEPLSHARSAINGV